MCTHHTTYFCGTCSVCQRDKLARWRRQLSDATTAAQASHRARNGIRADQRIVASGPETSRLSVTAA